MTRRLWLAVLTALLAVSCGGKGATPAETPQTVTTTAPQPAQSTSTTSVPHTITTTVAPTATTVAEPTPEATGVAASLRYTPDRDGFSFENFGGGEAPAELTVNMARRLYGDEQVCSSVVDNQCTPYPVILQLIQQANRSMRGGLCEGLTVLSLRLANDPAMLSSFQNVEAVAALVKADPALLAEIAYWYVTQFATEVQEQASAFLELSPLALARILYEDFAAAEAGEPSVGYTIGIYSEMGGHAVTPYRVTTDGDRWRIYIYDSNWPTSERWIDVDEKGWAYALAATNPTEESEAWAGGVGTMELTPMTSRAGPFTCGFCPTEDEESGTMLTVAASGSKQMSIQIQTGDGDRLGYYDGTFVNEIEGATYRYLISGPSTADPVLVFLPPGVDDFTADVEVIDVPAPTEVETSRSSVRPSSDEAPLALEPDEDTTQAFSLLILDDERAVQIEAEIPIEPEPVEPGEPEPEPERAPASLVQFSDESVEIGDIEEATVAIAVDALEVEIEIEQGQQIAVQFVAAPPVDPLPGGPTPDEPVVVEQPSVLSIAIADDAGVELATVEVDLTAYQVEAPVASLPTDPAAPEPTTPPLPQAPVVLAITFDEDTGDIDQQEEEIEAWVASDAEYFQAVAEDRVEEVLGGSYVEEIEERGDWEAPAEFDDGPDLAEMLIVEDDYWDDEQWDEVTYDNEWFEEQAEAVAETFAVVEEEEWWDEEPAAWAGEFVEEHADDSAVVVIPWEPVPEREVAEESPPPTTVPPTPTTLPLPPTTTAAPPPTTVAPPPTTTAPPPSTTLPPPTTTAPPPTTTVPPPTTTVPPPTTTVPPPTTTAPPPTTTEPPPTTTAAPLPTTTVPPPTTTAPPPTTTAPPPTTTVAPPTTTAPPPTTTAAPPPTTTIAPEPVTADPYEGRGDLPPGYATWGDFEQEVAAGIVAPAFAAIFLPDDVAAAIIPVAVYVPVHMPTVTYEYSDVALSEILSTEVATAQTGTATSTEVTGTEVTGTEVTGTEVTGTDVTTNVTTSLTNNDNDGYWYEAVATETSTATTTETTTATTTETTTATTVTNTLVDTTTVVARTGSDMTACMFVDGVANGCETTRGWNPETTTATAGDAYTEASTTNATAEAVTSATASATATVVATVDSTIPASCSQGGFSGLGDWCIVESGSRTDYEYVQFTLDETTNVRIDADTNLTYADFVAGNNQFGDPYIFLNHDTNAADGAHSGDASAVTLGSLIESDDDGGRDCSPTSACVNPPSNATDPDEFPNSVIAWDSGDTPVIVNVSDAWDSRIERMDLAPGDYVVRGSVYNSSHDGWYRLTIREDD